MDRVNMLRMEGHVNKAFSVPMEEDAYSRSVQEMDNDIEDTNAQEKGDRSRKSRDIKHYL